MMNTLPSQAQSAQQGNRTSDGKYTFGTHAEPEAISLAAGVPILRLERSHGERKFLVEPSEDPGEYNVFENGDQVAYFVPLPAEAIDDDKLWSAAIEELNQEGVIEACSECHFDLDGGEGYDGLCGGCADVEFAEDDDDQEYCNDCDEPMNEEGDCPDECGKPISEFVNEYGGKEVRVVRENYMEKNTFEVRDSSENEILSFSYWGDEQDHSNVWDAAKAALDEQKNGRVEGPASPNQIEK